MGGMRSHRPLIRRLGAAPAGTVALLIFLLAVSACSSGEETPTSSTGQSDFSAVNEIETCDNVDGRGVATGNIENTGTITATYTIDMEFTDAATGEVLGRGVVAVRAVEPGEAAEWTIEVDGVGDAELSCASKNLSAAG